MGYSIWLEFEEYADANGTDEDGYCNMIVTYDDGTREAFNVWTIDYFRDNVQSILAEAEEKGYETLPDLIVSRLERGHIELVMKRVLVQEQSSPILEATA